MSGARVGIDLGGTSIRAAVATGPAEHGEPVHRRTPASDGVEAVLEACAAAAREAAGGTPERVAIGIPGPLDPERGIVYAAPHLPGFEGLEAARLLGERLGCPVEIQNDASLAGYAEWIAGAGKGTEHFVFITVSTGIGGALVTDGVLHHGVAGTAGEVGHMPVELDGPPCGQGHRGCLEGLASGTAMAARARAALDGGERSSLSGLSEEALNAVAIAQAANAGDRLAMRLYSESGRAIGRAVGGLINLLSPEVIAVGGGLSSAGELLFRPLREAIGELAFREPERRCRVVPAGLGTDAGLVGAVAWVMRPSAGS
ncbi:MAG: ROK family protein [Candidatus Dormibacteria bacterium]